ncbi:hypothetical protein MRX96_033543 [Rhipicephalus microplus]
MKIGIGASPHDREVRAGRRVLYLFFSSSAPSFHLVLDFFIGTAERRMDAPEREKCCPAPPVFTVGEGRVERTEAISAALFSSIIAAFAVSLCGASVPWLTFAGRAALSNDPRKLG